jgi:syntaxin 6
MKKSSSAMSNVQYTSLKSTDDDNDDGDEELQNMSMKKQIARQDENLDALADSVSRLGALSLTISNEITSQNKMISDLDADVETAEAKTTSLIDKTKDIIKKTGGAKEWCIILVLFAVLLLLVFLVIYT